MSRRIAIIGDGQMGLVLADALAGRGLQVSLWGPFEDAVDSLASARQSPRLPGFDVSDEIVVSPDASEVLDGADMAINAIPTQFIRGVWERLSRHVPHGMPVASVAKGIELETLLRPTQVIEQMLGGNSSTCVLSGPTIATELARHQPAAMVASSDDDDLALAVQDLFDVPWLRVYTHGDPVGVELAGATKNVIAIAAGICDGMQLGDNAKSAMLARGLAEISRLGTALGAAIDTFFGIAGVGDLATTCFSPHGRNRTCGERLGRGEDLDTITESTGSVVEGVPTTKAVMELARRHQIEMPISEAVNDVLFNGLSIVDALERLMSRDLKAERLG